MLDIWPLLPIILYADTNKMGVDNIILALRHNDRIHELTLENFKLSSLQVGNASTIPDADISVPFLLR